ncbi:MAG TPA: hypothetical protein VFX06_14910 [Stellaceae bacterium]|jgi:hypothetical protein|nr:hypothetical protein [Stellaceae bacterium]
MLSSYLVLAGAMACVVGGIATASFNPRPGVTKAALWVGFALMLAALAVALTDPTVFSIHVQA